MPRKRRSTDGITFAPLGEEQREAFKMMLDLPGLRGVFEELARDGHQASGRGLIVWVSPNGLVNDLKPPVFCPAGEWRRAPLLANTPHPELLQALITYDVHTSYIVLLASGSKQGQAGGYTWWVEPFAKQQRRGQSHPLLS